MTVNRSLIRRRTSLAAVAVTAVLALAACGSDNGSDSGSSGQKSHKMSSTINAPASDKAGAHNAQDVTFAQGMIPHHRQALEMAKLAADRASSAQVKDLAARVEKAQDPEITTMTGWLKSWKEDVPEDMSGKDRGSMGSGMPRMLDTKDMAKLENASGKGFDTMFLTMMVEHHKGGVDLATAEKEKGKYAPGTKMANDIVTAQNAQIDEMNKLLGKS